MDRVIIRIHWFIVYNVGSLTAGRKSLSADTKVMYEFCICLPGRVESQLCLRLQRDTAQWPRVDSLEVSPSFVLFVDVKKMYVM